MNVGLGRVKSPDPLFMPLRHEPHSLVHLWSICHDPVLYASLDMAELGQHVPTDLGDGSWHRCCIPFHTFAPNEA